MKKGFGHGTTTTSSMEMWMKIQDVVFRPKSPRVFCCLRGFGFRNENYFLLRLETPNSSTRDSGHGQVVIQTLSMFVSFLEYGQGFLSMVDANTS